MDNGSKMTSTIDRCTCDRNGRCACKPLLFPFSLDGKHRHRGSSLIPKYLSYGQIPAYLKGNPFIEYGYMVNKSPLSCLRSLFCWNNQSLNIWSHVGGFMFFTALLFYDVFMILPTLRIAVADLIILTCALVSYQMCMIFSSCYHLFMSISENVHHSCLNLDLCGILLSFTSIFVSGIYFAFDCNHIWQNTYLVILLVIFVMVLILIWHPKSKTPRIITVRKVVFCMWAASGVIPTFHWIYISNGFSSYEVQILFPNVVVMYVISAVAFTFYLTKVPERFCPGKFDFIGSSHQIWHVLVVVSLWWWHKTGLQYVKYRSSSPCIADL